MKKIHVKPAPGLKIRDPHSLNHLPEHGADVPVEGSEGSFWLRRLAAGDVLEIVQIPDPSDDPAKE